MKADTTLLLTLAFFCSVLICTDACSCLRAHPQQHFCSSDFVILARVKRERTFNDTRVYKVRVRKEFKISEKGVLALKAGRIITARDDSMCGLQLQTGKLYVISGRIFSLKAYVNLCGMLMEWEKVTRRQRKGLKLLYRHGCTCQIKPCAIGRRCYRQVDSCNWSSDCETREGVCVRHVNKSCMWMKNRALSKCTKEWKRNITSIAGHKYNKSLFYHLP